MNDATGGPVDAVQSIIGVTAVYKWAIDDAGAAAPTDGFAISDGVTTLTISDISGVADLAGLVAPIGEACGYNVLNYILTGEDNEFVLTATVQAPIDSAFQPVGTGLTVIEKTAGVTNVPAMISSIGITYQGNLGFEAGTLSAAAVNDKLRVSGDTSDSLGSAPTFIMGNIEVSRGIHAPVGGAEITSRQLTSNGLEILNEMFQGINNT